MTTSKHQDGCKINVSYHAEVPFLIAPKIIAQIFTQCGERFYLGLMKKIYRADDYDRYFKAPGGKIKDIRHKGNLIGKNYI